MDIYDFGMDGRPVRDFAASVGRPGGENDGVDYKIHGYGEAFVPSMKDLIRRSYF